MILADGLIVGQVAVSLLIMGSPLGDR